MVKTKVNRASQYRKRNQEIVLKELQNLEEFWAHNKPKRVEDPTATLKILQRTTEKINVIKDILLKIALLQN